MDGGAGEGKSKMASGDENEMGKNDCCEERGEITMAEKVLCPYCGGEMNCNDFVKTNGKYLAYTMCSNKACQSIGPTVTGYETMTEARAAALSAAQARYLPPNRPLTLEEVTQLEADEYGEAPCWLENRGSSILATYTSTDPDELTCYGRYLRVWLRKPTQAEMDAAGWGGDAADD